MRFYRILCFIMIGFFMLGHVQARPKIGLALSGGGAKGIAHVGVLKWLEENKIPVDYVAGASIGAYVGALYSVGYSAQEIEEIMYNLDWESGYSDAVPRQDLYFYDKQQLDEFNIPLDLGFSDGEFKTPRGWLQGQSMLRLLYESFGVLPTMSNFSELPIPLRVVTTDLSNRRSVILSKGNLMLALRASMSVPSILAPIEINGRYLVDGGLSNNMPISLLKSMGADIVIAVDIGSSLKKNDELTGPLATMEQLITFLVDNSTRYQKNLMTEEDVLIVPNIAMLGTGDFSIINETTMKEGYKAAARKASTLLMYTASSEDYQQYEDDKSRRAWQLSKQSSKPIEEVNVQPSSEQKYLQANQNVAQLKSLSKADSIELMDEIYALNMYERVDFYLDDNRDKQTLVIDAIPKSWGPNYVYTGFFVEDGFTSDSVVTFNLGYAMTDLNAYKAWLRTDLQASQEESFVRLSYYQPLVLSNLWYTIARLGFYRERLDDIDYAPYVFSTYDKDSWRSRIGLGANLTRQFNLETGVFVEDGNLAVEVQQFNPTVDYKNLGYYAGLGFDSLDNLFFPSKGVQVSFVYQFYDQLTAHPDGVGSFAEQDRFVAPKSFESLDASWKGVVTFGSNSFIGAANYDEIISSDRIPAHIDLLSLGGFLNISGLPSDSVYGDKKLVGSLMYRHDLTRSLWKGSQYPLYLGFSVEAGNVWEEDEEIMVDDLVYGGSVFVGSDTQIGPIALAFGMTDTGEYTTYFFIGKGF